MFRGEFVQAASSSRFWLLLLTLGLACSSNSDDDGGAEPAAGSGGMVASAGNGGTGNGQSGSGGGNSGPAKLGGFTVDVKAGVTTLAGSIYDGEVPPNVVYRTTETAGGCKLMQPEVPFCDPACAGGAVCVANNRCIDAPTQVGIGTVRVEGLGAAFEMTPTATADSIYYQPPEGTALPAPLSETAEIRISGAGGTLGAFELKSSGIKPFTLQGGDSVAVDPAKALSVTWTAGTNTSARVHVLLDVSRHGGSKGKIECDVPDNGSLEVPRTMVQKLIALGLAGFPTIVFTRQSLGSDTVTNGVIELLVMSRAAYDVTVPGLISCNDAEDCPSGQTCQADQKCQ